MSKKKKSILKQLDKDIERARFPRDPFVTANHEKIKARAAVRGKTPQQVEAEGNKFRTHLIASDPERFAHVENSELPMTEEEEWVFLGRVLKKYSKKEIDSLMAAWKKRQHEEN